MAAPLILLSSTCWWHSVPRLALALDEVGFRVAGICPDRGHALAKLPAVQPLLPYSPTEPLAALANAILSVRPDLVIPCDDRAVSHLHRLHALASAKPANDKQPGWSVARLIEKSLGVPSGFPTTLARYPLLSLAEASGIPIPATAAPATEEQLDHWLQSHGLPCVVKADGTWGGRGVRIAHSAEEAHRAWRELSRPLSFHVALKRRVVDRDPFWLPEVRREGPRTVTVQSYVQGCPANCAVFCWEGRVLAAIAVEALRTRGPTTPATVVRVVDRPDMIRAAAVLAERLHMSGLFGLDFVIEQGTEIARLIEMNPRATPLCHVRLGRGRDLIGALGGTLLGVPCPAVAVTKADVIAYFPAAVEPGAGGVPAGAYLDKPAGPPELLAAMLRRPWQERGLVARVFYVARNVIERGSAPRAQKAPRVRWPPGELPYGFPEVPPVRWWARGRSGKGSVS